MIFNINKKNIAETTENYYTKFTLLLPFIKTVFVNNAKTGIIKFHEHIVAWLR